MFTGIIETLGIIKNLKKDNDNLDITVSSVITPELKVDQSVAHNGVCLTVVATNDNEYTVTAIKETLEKSTISDWKIGDLINLERGMKLGDRLDGHIVQGHVDQTAICNSIDEANGSWYFTFEYDCNTNNVTIEKGSVTVNGVSLTVVNSKEKEFSVAIIPLTFNHTNFGNVKVGAKVNLEFDIVGKYIARLYSLER